MELTSTIAPPPRAIRCGVAARVVCHTPVRLTLSIVCQSLSGISSSIPREVMPAVAHTISSPPNSVTASWVKVCTSRRLRTSTTPGMTRRPADSTSSEVLSRSARVAGGVMVVCTGAQISSAMMSAPSCAKRTAWARPMPRAAPVTRATLPVNRPVTLCLLCQSGVDHQLGAGDVPRFVGGQEDHRIADVDGFYPRHR
ncbi:Uncharacterised protein [Mycobacteroides abscessus subsp. abscessus]|nr:Uncharacterised protein [Mycobacteroides abscessus subsp. abscessus]